MQKIREITQKIFTHGTIQAQFEQTWKDKPEFLELPLSIIHHHDKPREL